MVACKSTTTPTPTKLLKIGYTTVFQDPRGMQEQNFMNLFAKMINDKGGWKIGNDTYKVQVIGYDDGFDPVKTTAAVQRLVYQDQVKHIICQFSSGVLTATLKVTEPEKVLVIGSAATNEIVKPEYKYMFRPGGLFFNKGFYSMAFNIYKNEGVTSVVNLNMDTEAGHTFAPQYVAIEESLGLRAVSNMYWPIGSTDYTAIATKVASLNPDLVFWSSDSGKHEWIQFISDLLQTGYKGRYMTDMVFPGTLPLLNQKIGQAAVDKLELLTYNSDPKIYQKDPKMLATCELYEKEYGKWEPENASIMAAWYTFEDAVNQTQSLDVEVLANYLSNNPRPVMTLLGWSQLFARPDMGNYRTIDGAQEMMISIVKSGSLEPYQVLTVKNQYLSPITALGLRDVYQQYWDKYGYPKFAGE
jgi:ABC-type branched-subunit amino acid transport system substrate-binding protein